MQVPQWIIEKKRDGQTLSAEEIQDFIQGFHQGTIPDYQMAAMAMAIYLKGMTFEEIAHLTRAMMDTGECLDTSPLTRPVCDKHSTGGIGDKVSLILAPLAAACGLDVPMISGRGLGITGGTLDKLETIPGFRTSLNETEMIDVLRDVHCCIIGQTERLAPADKKLYALRDVTGTVPSIPLITSSIMCKKMAEGLDALVLDVKVGRGAFMSTLDQARELAQTMVNVGKEMNTPVAALLTRMDEPLGRCVGNSLEVLECIRILQGEADGPLWDVSKELTSTMLTLCGNKPGIESARQQVQAALDSGAGLQAFRDMVFAQGGDPELCDIPEDVLPQASQYLDVPSPESGFVQSVDAEAVGRAVLVLGGGRTRSDDVIDPAVGLSQLVRTGDPVEKSQPLFRLHFNDSERKQRALGFLRTAIEIHSVKPDIPSPILERILPT
jgi:pyrimidine-nucleoside phosphorylase